MEARLDREEAKKKDCCCSHQVCFVSDTCPFDCIAITAPNPRASRAYLDELVRRLGGRGRKEVLILAVSDPEGVRIGSGGGTLNAVLEVKTHIFMERRLGVQSEYYSAEKESSTVSLD